MKNAQKGFVAGLLVIILIGVGVYFYIQNPKGELANNSEEAIKKTQTEMLEVETENVDKNFEIKKILYRHVSNPGDNSRGDLYSRDSNGKNLINLTKALNLPWPDVRANTNFSNIGWETHEGDTKVSMWVANTDGTGSRKVFETTTTGCNGVGISDISADGQAVIISYGPDVSGEEGPLCQPKIAPAMEVGSYYIKNSSEPVGLKFSAAAYMEGKYRTLQGFYNNDILVYDWTDGDVTHVSLLDPETMTEKKLFDTPRDEQGNVRFFPYLPSPRSTKVVTYSGDSVSQTTDIGIFDYKNNTIEKAITLNWRDVNVVEISPSVKNFIYQRQIRNGPNEVSKIDFFVYDIETGKSTQLPFSANGPAHLLVVWKDDSSFFYRLPFVRVTPPNESGTAMLFDLKAFKSDVAFGPVTDFVFPRGY